MVSKWSQNPYVLGCWTDPVIGTDSSVFANMAGRLKNLFFAGEATHADWYGFIQGGYYSGLERANDIAGCIQGGKCQPYEPSTGLPVIVKTRTGLQAKERSAPDRSAKCYQFVHWAPLYLAVLINLY